MFKGTIIRILYLLLLIFCALFAFSQQTSFDKIPTQQGEANLSVRQIIQDDTGILWIATFSGLYRYQGDDFILQHEFNNSRQINNDVTCLLEDNNRNLWIGTNQGVSKYNLETGLLHTYEHQKENQGSLPSNKIRSLCGDDAGRIWIGTSNAGLSLYDNERDSFISIEFDSTKVIPPVYIKTIFDKGNGELWIGTLNDGLYCVKYTGDKVDSICNYRAENRDLNLSDNRVYCIYKDFDGQMIVGTRNGLNVYNPVSETFKQIIIHQVENESMVNFFRSVYRDKIGRLWIGTWGGLIRCNSISDLENGEFDLLKHNRNIMHSVSHDQVMHVFEDNSGTIWLGTENGLNRYDPYQNQFQPLAGKAFDNIAEQTATGFCPYGNGLLILTLSDGVFYKQGKVISKVFEGQLKEYEKNKLYSIFIDSKQNIWIGSFNGLLIKLNPERDGVEAYRHTGSGDPIYSINEGKNRQIIIGTDGGGLKYFNPDTRMFLNDNNLQGDVLVSDTHTDCSGNFWVASYMGIFKKGRDNNYFEYFLPDNPDSINNPNIFFDIEETTDGKIYVGGRNGLYLYNSGKNAFDVLKFSNAGNIWVTNIQTDKIQNLWLNLNFNQIARLTRLNNSIQFFNVNNGIRSSQYNHRGFYMDAGKQLYISGFDQIYQFNTTSLITNSFSPVPFFTKLVINNEEVKPGIEINGHVILSKNISFQQSLLLNHKNKDFTISFASASYLNSRENKYRYKLQGYDDKWQITPSNSVNYTNLNPGKYVFEVYSANNDGIWSQTPAKIEIRVKPSPFLSFWAIMLYLLIGTVATIQFRRVINARLQLRRELLIERVKRDNEEKFHQERLRFYTNISHELRTPLTLILGPVKQLIANEKQNPVNARLNKLILNNTQRLLTLVNQLLDFRKSVYQGMKLKATYFNLVEIIETNLDAFSFMAKEKSIEVQYLSDEKNFEGWFDVEKINIILYNIFSNAFKFTPESGMIKVELNHSNDDMFAGKPYIVLKVSNSGKGIPKNEQQKVFERFYQISGQQNSINTGSGIGLSLVKSLVELHHGKITLVSEPDEITCFTVFIPYSRDEYSDEEVFDFKRDADRRTREFVDNLKQQESNKASNPIHSYSGKILLVEDNAELSGFLFDYLSSDFAVTAVNNGIDGLAVCESENPDLVISDVMMDKMDGIQFCQKLKSTPEISHIPIILMTALASVENKISGYKAGADDYITKPFEPELLKIRVTNILRNLEKRKREFESDPKISVTELTISGIDEDFLNQVLELLEKNLDNGDFDLEHFCKRLGVSSSHFYRKIKSITGLAPNEFIRTHRLKKAALLMRESEMNVSEIAFHVGFNDALYFSKCFKKQFGISPSHYAQKK